jgi:hypothetical protein
MVDSTTINNDASLHKTTSKYFRMGPIKDRLMGIRRVVFELTNVEKDCWYQLKAFYDRFKVSSVFKLHLYQITTDHYIDILKQKGYLK